MSSIFQDGFTYTQASLSLERTLEKFNHQKFGYKRWIVSFFWSPSLQSTIEKIQRLQTILPDEESPVSCAFIQLLAEHLTDEDIHCMNFSQLDALRRVRKIDDKELSESQRNLYATHKNFECVKNELDLRSAESLFETSISKMSKELLAALKVEAIDILRTILSRKGYSKFTEDDIEDILNNISSGKSLNVSLKERFPPDVKLFVNGENFHVNKMALSSSSGWFKELFDSAPEQGEFYIWENDLEGFKLLISYLIGQTVEISKGHEAMFRIYEQAVKYRVRSLIDLYDLKITECYDCFNRKEKVKILKSYPEMRAFRKLFDRDYLDVLKGK